MPIPASCSDEGSGTAANVYDTGPATSAVPSVVYTNNVKVLFGNTGAPFAVNDAEREMAYSWDVVTVL